MKDRIVNFEALYKFIFSLYHTLFYQLKSSSKNNFIEGTNLFIDLYKQCINIP
jgi:hypothetical protein